MTVSKVNPVALLAAALGVFALTVPSWLLLKPNRLVAGDAYGAFALETPWAPVLLASWGLLALAGLVRFRGRAWALALLASAALFAALLLTSAGTAALLAEAPDPERARVSLQGGVWVTLLAYVVGAFSALEELPAGSRWRPLVFVPGLGGALGILLAGLLNEVALARELTSQGGDFRAEVLRHLALSGTSVLLAALIGIPAAIWAARSPLAARVVLPTAAFLQTLPSLALFGLMLLPLARLGSALTIGEALLWGGGGLLASGALLWLAQRAQRGVLVLLALLVAAPPAALLTVMVAVVLNDLFVAALSLNLGGFSLPGSLSAPLSNLGVRGIGTAPALIALTLYAFLPIVRNTYTGLKEVPRAAVEAGRGMGMSGGQILRRVELPLALPLIIEGVRASAVLTVGITTVAFLIGAGGLGTFIERGIAQQVPDLILLGALPIILLALAADALLRGVGVLLTSRGVRP
ncbi:ABC transporter permease [Truepera radiovictrix]|uniref:Binding-protein-dependent transport systems inner membrane component n=1 Tax=Truepera radiovictrix (strain DSM 17093 / CIP 108686 / LMG 22925 / RQ-24) TaxID=649638 RepID=D7CY53_TRURR|nr:ABC transporter permease [Truepera radiovictrix]ADI14692.1 binding-protein-dependent transport systems inner membrane component [Truepera radiovictrix DSM 17093]WMT56758.1 ABC transporter permease [Truepera radiovictrix]